MKMKDEIRRRRQERIKKLTGEQLKPDVPIAEVRKPERDMPLPSIPVSTREADPEQVWKQQSQRWHEWKGAHRSGRETYDDSGRNNSGSMKREIQIKLLISVLLFGAIWGMFQLDTPWARSGQTIVADALSNEMNFEAVAAWYHDTFSGSPAFIPIFGPKEQSAERADGSAQLPVAVPVQNGTVIHTFAELLNGVEIAAAPGAAVSAVETGRVTVVSGGSGAGETILIQHANRRVTVYGKLGQSNVKVNDWVEAGEKIGSLIEAEGSDIALLFFAVKDNDKYIDPMDVVPLD
ncbi:peptidoglycan DD-metalloendopeptidase family protein [Paenibacillus tarimensis]